MTAAYDVVVVGAGPAGSVAALLLACRGHRVVIIDRAEFPRSKPCGESLNPGAVGELRDLGLLTGILRLPHRRLDRWRIHARGGAAVEASFGGDWYGVALARSGFDAALLSRAADAGVEIRTGVRVDDLVWKGERVVGVRARSGEAIGARLVIGADGLRSVVVRRLGLLRRGSSRRKLALTAHVEGAEAPAGLGVLGLSEWGCTGIVRIAGDTTNVALVLDGSRARDVAGDACGTFDRLARRSPYLIRARRTSPVMATGPFDWPTRAITADGALLVGDAAGYFDPFTGQGIFRAIRGARYAAEVGHHCLVAGSCTRNDLASYERLHRQSFVAGERIQRLIEIGVAHPALFAAGIGLLRGRPDFARRLLSVTGDIAPVRSIFLPAT